MVSFSHSVFFIPYLHLDEKLEKLGIINIDLKKGVLIVSFDKTCYTKAIVIHCWSLIVCSSLLIQKKDFVSAGKRRSINLKSTGGSV